MVDRLVLLTLRGVDLELSEERVHTERASFIRDDRHDPASDVLVATQAAKQPREAHRGRDFLRTGTGPHLVEGRSSRERQRLTSNGGSAWHRTTQRLTTLHHVLVLDRVDRWSVVRRVLGFNRLVGNLVVQVESVTQVEDLLLGHLLDLMGRVASLETRPKCPALDRLTQDHGWAATPEVLGRSFVGGVQLAVVVPATRQVAQVVVGEVRHHLAKARIWPEEVLADVGATLDCIALKLSIDGRVHLVEQHAVFILGEQCVPLRTPYDLDHVPTSTAEYRFQLLDDLAVATDRAVEALQVAVHDEHQVVELLA